MKKYFKKLFYSSAISFICVGINFDTEARVIKEVAEAVLPYLMEAAEIPDDAHSETTKKAGAKEYESKKIQAILDMIYTNEGQQQMVNWAVNDVRPQILEGEGAPFNAVWPQSSSNIEQTNGERLFQILFPCNTNTLHRLRPIAID